MSEATADAGDGGGAPNYENPEAKARLDAARREREAAETIGETADAATATSARRDLAAEEQPGRDLPDLTDTFTVPFRGHDFEFREMGDTVLDAITEIQEVQGDDDTSAIVAGSRSADFVYRLLGEKCTHPDAGEAYWRQYDISRDDADDIFDLFDRLTEVAMGEPDLNEEQQERLEQFRDQS